MFKEFVLIPKYINPQIVLFHLWEFWSNFKIKQIFPKMHRFRNLVLAIFIKKAAPIGTDPRNRMPSFIRIDPIS